MNSPAPPDRSDESADGFAGELAGRLSRRRIEPPSAELAARVRRSVATELRAPRREQAASSWLAYASGLAAVFVTGTSLSFIAVADTRGRPRPPADPARIAVTARAIRELVPGLSEAEARRISVIDDARSEFLRIPQPRANGVRSAHLMMQAYGARQ